MTPLSICLINIISFDDTHHKLFKKPKLASQYNKLTALKFIKNFNAANGTEMLGPIQSSTAQANQIAELMFSIFTAKLDAAKEAKLKELNKKHGTEIKTLPDKEVALLAKELERYIPRYSGALENSPVGVKDASKIYTDLLTSSVDRDDTSSKSAVTVEYTPNAPETIKSKSMTPVTKRYESPGASAVIRAIINKEASVMSETEGLYTNVLTTFDGVLGQPETLEKFSKELGNQPHV